MLNQPLLKRRVRRQFCLKLFGVIVVVAAVSVAGYFGWYFLQKKPKPVPPIADAVQFDFVTQMGTDVSLFVRQRASTQNEGPLVSTQLRLRFAEKEKKEKLINHFK